MSGQFDGYESDEAYNAETDVDVIIEDSGDERVDIDYGSDIEDAQQRRLEDQEIPDSENENDNVSCGYSEPKYKVHKQEYISDLRMSENVVFDMLDPEEKKYLPLNFIVSPMMEWRFIQEACASGFRSVKNLARVSNKTIREIANISQYTLDNGTSKIPKLNQAFIDYAFQRGI